VLLLLVAVDVPGSDELLAGMLDVLTRLTLLVLGVLSMLVVAFVPNVLGVADMISRSPSSSANL
jgi:hypothetical protein